MKLVLGRPRGRNNGHLREKQLFWSAVFQPVQYPGQLDVVTTAGLNLSGQAANKRSRVIAHRLGGETASLSWSRCGRPGAALTPLDACSTPSTPLLSWFSAAIRPRQHAHRTAIRPHGADGDGDGSAAGTRLEPGHVYSALAQAGDCGFSERRRRTDLRAWRPLHDRVARRNVHAPTDRGSSETTWLTVDRRATVAEPILPSEASRPSCEACVRRPAERRKEEHLEAKRHADKKPGIESVLRPKQGMS
jgi:hypothetical protein